MKTSQGLLLLIAIMLIIACKSGAPQYDIRSTFDGPFPKRNINLSNVLGDELLLKKGKDTARLLITSTKTNNLITDSKTGDTLFLGTVCRFRGLYYFNFQLNDTSWWLYAVKTQGNLIYGLNTMWEQMSMVDYAITSGRFPKIVKYPYDYDIRLHSDKKELKKLYTYIVDSSLSADTILYEKEQVYSFIDTSMAELSFDPEEMELVTKVFPNPTSGYVTIQTNKNDKLQYQLINMEGKPVVNGISNDREIKLDLRKFPDGLYLIELYNPKSKEKEILKILKTGKTD
jgi:hypothetical protein